MSFILVTKDNVEEFADSLGFTSLVKRTSLDYFDRRCPIKTAGYHRNCTGECKLYDVAKAFNPDHEIGKDVCPLWRMHGIWNHRKDVPVMLDDSLLGCEVEDI